MPGNYRDDQGANCFKKSAFGHNGPLLEFGFWTHQAQPDYIFVVNGTGNVRVELKVGTSELFSC